MIRHFRSSFIIGIILSIIIFILAIISFLQNRQEKPTSVFPTPTTFPLKAERTIVLPKDIRLAPTFAPERGQGIDIESQVIKDATSGIAKITPLLPYEQTLTLSTGIPVEIVIPTRGYSSAPWTLTAQIFGINYQTSSTQSDYAVMRTSFREAASLVFAWLRSHDVDPKKIYIDWGDKVYIQDNAEAWLK